MVSHQNQFLYSQQYSFEFPRHQDFSLPESFLDYINQNGAVYEKLIKTCKYFFAHHQLVPMKDMILGEPQVWKNGVNLTWKYDEVNSHMVRDKINIDLKKSKLWIYDSIRCWHRISPNLFSSFSKAVYRCTPTSLDFFRQNIDGNEFSKISINIKDIKMTDTTFFNPDKSEASLWGILTLMPKLEHCLIDSENKNLLTSSSKDTIIPVLPNLEDFNFSGLSKDDFPTLAEFIKLHPNTKFEITIKEKSAEIDVEVFKSMLGESFPGTLITQDRVNNKCKFQWTLESQYVRVLIE